jgi:hypothetical protein
MSEFVPGLKISQQFYEKIVAPIIQQDFPNLVYSAALIGPGSEVLGFDTALSTDHDWRPRVFIFLSTKDSVEYCEQVEETIRKNIPQTFMDYPTSVARSDNLCSRFVYSLNEWVEKYLGLNLEKKIGVVDWLTSHEHHLRSFVEGEIFYDKLNELTDLRTLLSYYPHDIWLYQMASEWIKISQEQAFIGRTGDVGDDLGSRLITSRIVHSIMRICFYLEKTYIPYSKWFGVGFGKLKCATVLRPLLEKVMSSNTWKERELALAPVYEIIIKIQNEFKVTNPINTNMRSYFNRPYMVIDSDDIVSGLRSSIQDEKLKSLPLIGSVNQFTESVDFVDDNKMRDKAKKLYE